MIVPMKKVSLITLGERRADTLKKLRKLGLMHIEINESSGEKLDRLKERKDLLASSIFIAKDWMPKKARQKNAGDKEALEIAERISRLSQKKSALEKDRASLASSLERLKAWGEINTGELKELEKKGIFLTLYECPRGEYDELAEDAKVIVFEKSKALVRFALIGGGQNEELKKVISQYEIDLPEASTVETKAQIDDIGAEISKIEEELTSLSQYSSAMNNAIAALEKELEFEGYAAGMKDEILSKKGEKGVSVAYFEGYIEAENADKLSETAKSNSWGIILSDPSVDDDVPTKLKNNKFVSLIYPLTDFLGTVPGYFEYDISAWFLGFILIFFGIIFGDGGYGLLISAVALIPILKSLISKKPIPPAFLLVGLFGLSTILWGTLTCTWFGFSPEQLPEWLKGLSIPVISNVYADKIWHLPFSGEMGLTTAQNLQIFCFTLALIQLNVAHIMGAVRNRKSLKMLGDIGSMLQLIGIYYVVLSLVVNPQVFPLGLNIGGVPVGTLAIALVGIGFLMSFIFSNFEGSIIKSILESLKNIVSVLLGVVNVFSDIVSYIRLWAVGLAGAAISATVNELASPLLGNFLFMVIAIVLLVFGHGLNMILNVLSVIVHGIRLNTLEFSSHLDMSWSGHKFKPFEE